MAFLARREAGRDACAPRASGSPVKLAQFSKRFHHQLLSYVPRIRKPALDGCGNSFEPRNSRFRILIAGSQHGLSSDTRRLILRFAAKTQTGDPSSSAICPLCSPPNRAEARVPEESANQHCDPERSRWRRWSGFQCGSARALFGSFQSHIRPATPCLADTSPQTS